MSSSHAPDDTQRRQALWARHDRACAASKVAMERVARTTPNQMRAITDEMIDLQQQLRARVDTAKSTTRSNVIPLIPRRMEVRLSRSLLVIEDDPEARGMLMELLRREFRVPVYGAGTAREARQLWYDWRCCGVIADFHLGVGEGGEEFLRALPDAVGRVLISGTSDDSTMKDAASLAGAAWWRKGGDTQALLVAVADLLNTAH